MRQFEILYDQVINPIIPEIITEEWIYTEVKARLMVEGAWRGDEDEKLVRQITSVFVDENSILQESWIADVVAGVLGIIDPTGIVSFVHSITYWLRGQYFMGTLTLLGAIPAVGSAASLLMTSVRTKKPLLQTLNALHVSKKATRVGGRLRRRAAKRKGKRSNEQILAAAEKNAKLAAQKSNTDYIVHGITPTDLTMVQRFFEKLKVPKITAWIEKKATLLLNAKGPKAVMAKRIGKVFNDMSDYLRRVNSFILGTTKKGGAIRHGVGSFIEPSRSRRAAAQQDVDSINTWAGENVPGWPSSGNNPQNTRPVNNNNRTKNEFEGWL